MDRLYFTVSRVHLPDLHFEDYDDELDHNWHEFEALTFTDEGPTDEKKRDIEEFLMDLRNASIAIGFFQK